MLLSIISPFHNSRCKCQRLLKSLMKIDSPDVEIILVDDGSVDGTYDILSEFKKIALVRTTVVYQENKGPGGARNHGLRLASGSYVWFVDSDDDINSEVIDEVRDLEKFDYDFIDFNIVDSGEVVNTIGLGAGEHLVCSTKKGMLISKLGRMWAKVIKRRLIIENGLQYPEFCIYEDNPYEFIYPFYVRSFYKSESLAYYYIKDHGSVTRSDSGERFFDRMPTAIYGLCRSLELANPEEKKILEEKFVRLYLFNTVAKQIKKIPNRNWVVAIRVMRQYRDVAREYQLGINPLDVVHGNKKYKCLFFSLWFFSCLFPSQEEYFKELREVAWGRIKLDVECN